MRDGEDTEQVDSYISEHMDPVQQRLTLHFQHLLFGSQIKPRLRPINARHRLCCQRRRSHRRCSFRLPLLRGRRPPPQPPLLFLLSSWPMGGYRCGGDPVLCGLFLLMAFCRRSHSPAAGAAHVPLHVPDGSCSDLFQHG